MQNKPPFDQKSGAQDKVEGTLKNLAGKAKETTGKVVGNPNLEAEGDAEQLEGKVQKKVGQIKQVFNK